MYRNFITLSANEKVRFQKKKLKMKKNAMDPVDFEEEKRKDPKYKTELCKSFMETNFCVYGNKCRFAHGYKELVVKAQINNYKKKMCNSFFKFGFCPYGSRCNFKHDERKIEDFEIPYYMSHLISCHFLRLKTCERLSVFDEITRTNYNNNRFNNNNENTVINNNIHYNNNNTINNNNNNNNYKNINSDTFESDDENCLSPSTSYLSEKSSQASSLNCTPKEKKNISVDFSVNEFSECLPKELNFDINFFFPQENLTEN